MSESTEWTNPDLDLEELKREHEERVARRSDTDDHDTEDEHVQTLLRGDDDQRSS